MNAIHTKFDPNENGIEFGEFVSVCAFLLICNKIMEKFDKGTGRLNIDINGLGCLGMWFIWDEFCKFELCFSCVS